MGIFRYYSCIFHGCISSSSSFYFSSLHVHSAIFILANVFMHILLYLYLSQDGSKRNILHNKGMFYAIRVWGHVQLILGIYFSWSSLANERDNNLKLVFKNYKFFILIFYFLLFYIFLIKFLFIFRQLFGTSFSIVRILFFTNMRFMACLHQLRTN